MVLNFDKISSLRVVECVVQMNVIYCQLIRDAFAEKKEVLTKTTYADLVTETDKNVEDLIIGSLRKRFPTHRCLISTVNNNTIKSYVI